MSIAEQPEFHSTIRPRRNICHLRSMGVAALRVATPPADTNSTNRAAHHLAEPLEASRQSNSPEKE
jgi:hypothetical protein